MPQQQQQMTGAAPQHIKDDLEKNNRSCFYKMTHKSEWFCGLSLRTGVFTIGIIQLLVCAVSIYGMVKDKDDDTQKKPFALGTAIVCGLLFLTYFFGALLKNILLMKIGRGVAIFNIFLAIATLIVILVLRNTDGDDSDSCVIEGHCRDYPVTSIVMQAISCLASILSTQISWSYLNILRGNTKPTHGKKKKNPNANENKKPNQQLPKPI